jgi:hypothetical protein
MRSISFDTKASATMYRYPAYCLWGPIFRQKLSTRGGFRDSISGKGYSLCKLGEARVTLAEQRLYLMHISQSFSFLVKAATDSLYIDEFFGNARTTSGCDEIF